MSADINTSAIQEYPTALPTHVSPWADDYPLNTYYIALIYFVCITGLIGNVLVIGSIFVHKKLRVLCNSFIVNLAAADLCVIIVVDIFSLVGVHTRGLYFVDKPILCEFLGIICITSCACSLWSIAAIAINRYICICHRLLYLKLFTRKTMPFVILAIWTISFMVDFPILIGWGRHAFDQRLLYCTYDLTASLGYSLYLAICLVTIPFIFITYSYVRILRFSQNAKKNLKRHQQGAVVGYAIRTTDLRLLKSILTIWLTYTLLWLPYLIVILFDQKGHWGRPVYVFVNALAHASSSTNSLIYPVTNKNFLEAYIYQLKTVFCWWRSHHSITEKVNRANDTVISCANVKNEDVPNGVEPTANGGELNGTDSNMGSVSPAKINVMLAYDEKPSSTIL